MKVVPKVASMIMAKETGKDKIREEETSESI
jgi:hypothetical protein